MLDPLIEEASWIMAKAAWEAHAEEAAHDAETHAGQYGHFVPDGWDELHESTRKHRAWEQRVPARALYAAGLLRRPEPTPETEDQR